MHTDPQDAGREERRARLERRRAAVTHQLRRLAIELADLDRQLDEIEQSVSADRRDYYQREHARSWHRLAHFVCPSKPSDFAIAR